MDQLKKGFKPSPFRKGEKSNTDNNYNKIGTTISSGIKCTGTSTSGWNNIDKEVKCWGCNRPQLYQICPHNPNKKMAPINMVHEASTVNEIARNIPRINATLEDRHADHQSTMLEVEGKTS